MAEKNKAPKLLSREDQAKATEKAENKANDRKYEPRTAQDVAATVGAVQSDNEKEKARKAGVVDAAYIDYEKALENYESRDDVEPLEQRRAREAGTNFHVAKFRRQVGGVDHSGVTTTDADEVEDTKNEGPSGAN